MKYASLLAIALMSVASPAFSQIVLTPRISHAYNVMEGTLKASDPTTGLSEEASAKDYQNSYHVSFEVAYSLSDFLEPFLNVGYTPLWKDGNGDIHNVDLGVRSSFANAYAQLSVGESTIKFKGTQDSSAVGYTLPTFGFGLGYFVPVAENLKLDIFYRGTSTIGESKEEEFQVDGYTFTTKVKSNFAQELGLGFRIAI